MGFRKTQVASKGFRGQKSLGTTGLEEKFVYPLVMRKRCTNLGEQKENPENLLTPRQLTNDLPDSVSIFECFNCRTVLRGCSCP